MHWRHREITLLPAPRVLQAHRSNYPHSFSGRPLERATVPATRAWASKRLDGNPIDCATQSDNLRALVNRGVWVEVGCKPTE
jgi:hypothetical protein